MLGQLHERSFVVTCFIQRHKLGPSDYCLFSLAKQGTFKIAVRTKHIELLFRPTRRSPDQAIVLDSVLALI